MYAHAHPEKVASFASIEGNLAPEDCFLSRQALTHPEPTPEAFQRAFMARLVTSRFYSANLFAAASTGQELKKLIGALPGFGEQKARIFVALLGKQWGVTPDGWREAAGDFGQDGHRSVADITSPETLRLVREHKKEMKAAAKASKVSSR